MNDWGDMNNIIRYRIVAHIYDLEPAIDGWIVIYDDMEKAIAAAVAAEREACAAVCENHIAEQVRAGLQPNYKQAAKNCAKHIRNRSNLK